MAEQLDREQVHCVGEGLVVILRGVQLGGGGEGVHEDEGGFRRVVFLRHMVGGGDAAQVGDLDGLGAEVGRHVDDWEWVAGCQSEQKESV